MELQNQQTHSPETSDDEQLPLPIKKPINYEDSELLKKLKNYNIEPEEKIKRKMDYFYSPYYQQFNAKKHMNFQTVEIPDVAKSKYTARKKSPLKEPKYKDVRRFTE